MLSLDRLLSRPNLTIEERLMIMAKAAIWPGDWKLLAECLERAQSRKLNRDRFAETFLQAILFYGFPRVVSAFGIMKETWPNEQSPEGNTIDSDQAAKAGRRLFDEIYGKNSSSVHRLLASYHAELHGFVLEAAYGRILSRPGLDPRVRELLACAALVTMGQIPQLIAHARGAIHFGASPMELRETLTSALRSEVRIEDLLRRALPSSNLGDS